MRAMLMLCQSGPCLGEARLRVSALSDAAADRAAFANFSIYSCIILSPLFLFPPVRFPRQIHKAPGLRTFFFFFRSG